MSCFFVAGTDTNVGKTTASRAIIQALQTQGIQIVGYKPIACNRVDATPYFAQEAAQSDYDTMDNSDVLTLLNASREPLSYQDINSYTFNQSLPMLTQEKSRIRLAKINERLDDLTRRYQSVVVEGSFGLCTPMAEGKSFADWIAQRHMPVVLVVGIKDGCINHALLTVRAIKELGVPLLGWIANRINPLLGHYAEIINLLETHIDAPLIGKIPYLHKPEEQELGHYLTNTERLTYMQTAWVK